MTLLCMRCAGADCTCGRLAWLVNFTRLAAAPTAPAERCPCPTEADDGVVLEPKEG
jgi:hypothetical protein